MNKNVERGRSTRAQLIDVATRLFATRGYEGTSVESVLAGSGASRGSLYHHFRSKEALFSAVVGDAGARAAQLVAEAMRAAPDSLAAFRIACLAWIRLACDPVVRQILLIDAPAVLGWQRWRELDEDGPLGMLRVLLTDAANLGRINPDHVDAFAHIVLAALNELALMIARADNRADALAIGESATEEFLDRLLGVSGGR